MEVAQLMLGLPRRCPHIEVDALDSEQFFGVTLPCVADPMCLCCRWAAGGVTEQGSHAFLVLCVPDSNVHACPDPLPRIPCQTLLWCSGVQLLCATPLSNAGSWTQWQQPRLRKMQRRPPSRQRRWMLSSDAFLLVHAIVAFLCMRPSCVNALGSCYLLPTLSLLYPALSMESAHTLVPASSVLAYSMLRPARQRAGAFEAQVEVS